MAKRLKRERASAKKRAQEHGSYDLTTIKVPQGVGLMKLKEGIMKVDFLEYKVTQEGNKWAAPGLYHYERTFYVHRGVGPNDEAFVCPKKTAGKKCPICEHIARLNKEADADTKLIKSLLPKERQLFQGVNSTTEEEKEKGLQLLECAHFNFGKRLDKEIRDAEDSEGLESFAAHTKEEGGMTLKLGVEEKSFEGREFMAVETIKFLPRKDDIDGDILTNVMDLDQLLIVKSYDELKKIFLQEEDAEEEKKPSSIDDDDDDDDKKPEPPDDDDDDVPVLKFEVGNTVTGVYNDKPFTGKVEKLDVKNDLVHVRAESGKLRVMNSEDLEVVKAKKEDKKPPKPEKKPEPPDDDDDDVPAAPPPKADKKPKPDKAPKPPPPDDDDDDDVPDDSDLDDDD